MINNQNYSQFKLKLKVIQSGNKEVELEQDNFISSQCNIVVYEEDIV